MYDRDQAVLRLNNTMILYDGRPYLVCNVRGTAAKPILECLDLPKQRDVLNIAMDDDLLNFRVFNLGYVNYQGDAHYLTRLPARQQKQGLCDQTVLVGDGRQGWRFQNVMNDPCIQDLFAERYPSFREVVDKLKPGHSMAFSRRFALAMDPDLGFYELRYKGERVAWGDPAAFNLPSSYTYLSEVIQQEGIQVR